MRRHDLGVGIVAEVVSHEGLYGEGNLHALLLGLGKNFESLRDKIVLVEGFTDLAALSLDECISHAAADDEVVHLVEEVLKHGKFG